MNIVLYGFEEKDVRALAERYGVGICHTFEALNGEGDRMLLQSQLCSAEQQLAFFDRMSDYESRIDIVVAVHCESSSMVHYSTQPGKFFTLNNGPDPEDAEYELVRIIETLSGRICAHEGI